MQREYPNQPLLGVGAVIVEDGRVLLIKRGKAPLLGEWSIPGGMLELGETLRQGAEREALEETGLVVRATDLLHHLAAGQHDLRKIGAALVGIATARGGRWGSWRRS